MQLTRNMFDVQGTSPAFGIKSGQFSFGAAVATNAYWYNKRGERIGHGDLYAIDIDRITGGIDPDELFIVVMSTLRKEDVETVAKNANFIIGYGRKIIVDFYKANPPPTCVWSEVTFEVMTAADANKFLLGS